ncbi:hypothetical protein [Chromobacterium haemolyticum]|uniref:hypothetical protein n=1 Tax=Chromobacterium haemolyticum TaxID=394935 RepID=UPI0012DDFBFB|nr:hypothetical protein [Chromobacterium haemolyticum]
MAFNAKKDKSPSPGGSPRGCSGKPSIPGHSPEGFNVVMASRAQILARSTAPPRLRPPVYPLTPGNDLTRTLARDRAIRLALTFYREKGDGMKRLSLVLLMVWTIAEADVIECKSADGKSHLTNEAACPPGTTLKRTMAKELKPAQDDLLSTLEAPRLRETRPKRSCSVLLSLRSYYRGELKKNKTETVSKLIEVETELALNGCKTVF